MRQSQVVEPLHVTTAPALVVSRSLCTCVHVVDDVQESGMLCVVDSVSVRSKAYVRSALKVARPESSMVALTTQSGHSAETPMLSQALLTQPPSKRHVPTTSPPHGGACRQPAGPPLPPPLPLPQPAQVARPPSASVRAPSRKPHLIRSAS